MRMQLAHYFPFFVSQDKDGSRNHQVTCQQMKWLSDYEAELISSTQSTLKNLALLCGYQIKPVPVFIYICW